MVCFGVQISSRESFEVPTVFTDIHLNLRRSGFPCPCTSGCPYPLARISFGSIALRRSGGMATLATRHDGCASVLRVPKRRFDLHGPNSATSMRSIIATSVLRCHGSPRCFRSPPVDAFHRKPIEMGRGEPPSSKKKSRKRTRQRSTSAFLYRIIQNKPMRIVAQNSTSPAWGFDESRVSKLHLMEAAAPRHHHRGSVDCVCFWRTPKRNTSSKDRSSILTVKWSMNEQIRLKNGQFPLK